MSRPYFPEYFDDDLREMRQVQAEHDRRVKAWLSRHHIDSHSTEPPPDPEDDPFPQQPEF